MRYQDWLEQEATNHAAEQRDRRREEMCWGLDEKTIEAVKTWNRQEEAEQ